MGIFDAKFKFNYKLIEQENDNKVNEEILAAKRADIYKMHTYRDVLQANFAIILYPGNKNKFFSLDAQEPEIETNDPENAIKYLLEENLKGVGYIALTPKV